MMYKKRVSLFTLLLVGVLGLVFFTTGSAYAACEDGITNYWKLDDPADGPYVDFIDGNNGTGAVAPSAVAGQVNGAQAFNGTNQGIDVTADRSFGWYKDESFSIEYWMKRDPATDPVGFSGTEVLVGREEGGGVQWWVGIWGTNALGKTVTRAAFVLIATNGDGSATAELLAGDTTDLTDGQWHHIVAVRDGTDNILYVDGAEEARVTIAYGAGFYSLSAPLNLGKLSGAYYYGGALDEVALYDRALLQSEIDQHYDNGLLGRGIDYVAPDDDDDDDDGGGGGGGCFIATVAK